jgi:hypothetical protein
LLGSIHVHTELLGPFVYPGNNGFGSGCTSAPVIEYGFGGSFADIPALVCLERGQETSVNIYDSNTNISHFLGYKDYCRDILAIVRLEIRRAYNNCSSRRD